MDEPKLKPPSVYLVWQTHRQYGDWSLNAVFVRLEDAQACAAAYNDEAYAHMVALHAELGLEAPERYDEHIVEEWPLHLTLAAWQRGRDALIVYNHADQGGNHDQS